MKFDYMFRHLKDNHSRHARRTARRSAASRAPAPPAGLWTKLVSEFRKNSKHAWQTLAKLPAVQHCIPMFAAKDIIGSDQACTRSQQDAAEAMDIVHGRNSTIADHRMSQAPSYCHDG